MPVAESTTKLRDKIKDRLKKRPSFSLIEVLLALAVFSMLVVALVGSNFYGQQSNQLSGARLRAIKLAEEGLEASRSIRDNNFANLTDGNHGLLINGGNWIYNGTSDLSDVFTRTVAVSTSDANTKTVISTVTWQQDAQRTGQVQLSSYLSNWRAVASTPPPSGYLVYGDGGTTTDAIKYRVLDGASGTWGTAQSTADIDAATTNKALRASRIFASATRNEKVVISRHYNGTNQFIYAQVFNGTSWGNVNLLSSWAATTYLDVQNFDGTYLANGDFMAVYSDNSITPKFKIWNGTTWSASAISMQSLATGTIPNFIIAKARSGTNEVMTAFFSQNLSSKTEYFNNSSGYATASWTLHANHATAAPVATKRLIDFEWSPGFPTKGVLTYGSAANDRSMEAKIWTANGSGGGSWSLASSSANQGTLGAMQALARPGATEQYIACDHDASQDIYCSRINNTPSWTAPTNPYLTTTSDTGIQRPFDIAFETKSGVYAVGVYSDATVTPKLKKYNPATNVWDATATDINNLSGTLKTVRAVGKNNSEDIIIFMSNSNRALYSVGWNGTTHSLYSAPAGLAFSTHGTNGSAITDYWYDFAWSLF